MSENLTEEQQVEELKKWWKENGRSIIAGVIIGLGAIGGWQGWNSYKDGRAESGAQVYDKFVQAAKSGNEQGSKDALAQLRGEYEGSTYFLLAQLKMAQAQVSGGEIDAAIGSLRAVISATRDDGLKQVASVRLARLLLSQDKLDEAQAAVDAASGDAFAGDVAAIRGEIARRQGRTDDARAAFEEARLKGAADSDMLDYLLLEMATSNKQEQS